MYPACLWRGPCAGVGGSVDSTPLLEIGGVIIWWLSTYALSSRLMGLYVAADAQLDNWKVLRTRVNYITHESYEHEIRMDYPWNIRYCITIFLQINCGYLKTNIIIPIDLSSFWAMKAAVVYGYHWNRNGFILMIFLSLAALEVVILTTSSAASDENFVKMTFSYQWPTSPPVTIKQSIWWHFGFCFSITVDGAAYAHWVRWRC